MILGRLSPGERAQIRDKLLDDRPILLDPREILHDIAEISDLVRKLMLHTAGWFELTYAPPRKSTMKPPLHETFLPLLEGYEDPERKAMHIQREIITLARESQESFTKESIRPLLSVQTLGDEDYADRFEHPPWRMLLQTVQKCLKVPFRLPSMKSVSSTAQQKPAPGFDHQTYLQDAAQAVIERLEPQGAEQLVQHVLNKKRANQLHRQFERLVWEAIRDTKEELTPYLTDVQACQQVTGVLPARLQVILEYSETHRNR
jgi:hypothetical protein